MNVVASPLQVPYCCCTKSLSIKRNPKCVASASGATSLVIDDTIQGQASTSMETPKTQSVTARRLILLRHAKSSWENRSIRDHDRPLSRAGQLDAIKVSQKLLKLGWIPELILSSDALRTRETLTIMQEQVQAFSEAEIHFISSFYSVAAMDGQTAEHLKQAICKYSRDEILTVMCMGHNRGWEEAASMLSGVSVELKTSNAALLEATGKSWEEIAPIASIFSTGICISDKAKKILESRGPKIKAFSLAGPGGWKLQGLVKPDTSV